MKPSRIFKATALIVLVALLSVIVIKRNAGEPAAPEPEETAVSAVPEVVETPAPPEPILLTASDGSVLEFTEDSTTADISNSEFIALLAEHSAELPALTEISLADGMAFRYSDIALLQESFPNAAISYQVFLQGNTVSPDTEELDLSALGPGGLEEAIRELGKLGSLKSVNLNPPEDEEPPLALEDVSRLQDALPELVFDYRFTLFDQTFSTADERIEFENVDIGDDGVENTIRPLLPYLKQLKYLKLDKCDVTSPVMAQLRDDFPDIKVVWRIYFSSYGEGPFGKVTYNCLTDTEKIWATGCVTDYFAAELKYCTDVKYLDLGHNCITNIDFVNYMPKLEVAVLSITWLADLSPLANCPNLEYLEVFSSKLTDITPLASCKNLKHLNISNLKNIKDISCLYELGQLERLFCSMSYIPQEQQDEFQRLHPNCECEFGWVDPSKSTWRFKDGNANHDTDDNYVERYAKLRDQIGYSDPANLSC